MRSDDTLSRICLELADEVAKIYPSQDSHQVMLEILKKPWIQVVFSADGLLLSRRDKKYISPFYKRACSARSSAGFDLMRRTSKICFSSESGEPLEVGPAWELAGIMVDGILTNQVIDTTMPLMMAIESQAGLEGAPVTRTDVITSFRRAYALLITDVLSGNDSKEALQFLASKDGQGLFAIKTSAINGSLLAVYTTAICEHVRKSGTVKNRSDIKHFCG